MAMDTLLRCPPEREEIFRFSRPVRRTSVMASLTRSRTSALDMLVRMRSIAV